MFETLKKIKNISQQGKIDTSILNPKRYSIFWFERV